eukprot:6500271-Prymnesium_polylepis.1
MRIVRVSGNPGVRRSQRLAPQRGAPPGLARRSPSPHAPGGGRTRYAGRGLPDRGARGSGA